MSSNTIYRAFRFRLYPTQEQADYFERVVGSCRFVYNKLLEKSLEQYKTTGKFILGLNLTYLIPELKKEYEWLKDVDSMSLQQSSRHLAKAFSNRFDKKRKKASGFPNFKKKGVRDSFTIPKGYRIESRRIKIPKIGWISCRTHRKLEGKVKSLVISKDVDQWYVSILCEMEDNPKDYDLNKAVGIDLGIKSFAVTSDGEVLEVPKKLKKHQKRLKQLQRRHAKKKKGSKNREKARIKVARQHRKIRRINKNFIETASSAIAKQYDVVSLETLNIQGMKKNRRLSGAIQQLSWYAFSEVLKRKVHLVHRVDRFYPSSKTCSSCGWIKKDLKLSDRTFECDSCDNIVDRDANAANNLLNHYKRTVASAGIACGEEIRPKGSKRTGRQTSVKQEHKSVETSLAIS